jgi:hypothetical protein
MGQDKKWSNYQRGTGGKIKICRLDLPLGWTEKWINHMNWQRKRMCDLNLRWGREKNRASTNAGIGAGEECAN